MRHSADAGLYLFVIFVLAVEFMGARAYLNSLAHNDPLDYCHGYAICR